MLSAHDQGYQSLQQSINSHSKNGGTAPPQLLNPPSYKQTRKSQYSPATGQENLFKPKYASEVTWPAWDAS